MANTEIDSLSLDIKITGLKKEDVANIDKLSRAVARLTKSLQDADFSKLKDIKIPKGLKSMQFITQNLQEAKTKNDAQTGNTREITKGIEETGDAYVEASQNIEDSAFVISNGNKKIAVTSRSAIKQLKALMKEVEGKKGQSNTQKKISRLQKTLNRFKTIAFIKAVRAVINAIVQSVQKSISNLASYDKEFNELISRIKTSATNAINSLSLIVRPLIEQIEPFLQEASNILVQIGNEVNKINSALKGQNTYTKISSKYAEDYAKSMQKASLFSFDTFNTLNTGDNQMYETETISEEEINNGNELYEIISSIREILGTISNIGTYTIQDIVKKVKQLMPSINNILNLVKKIIDTLDPLIRGINDSLSPLIEVLLSNLLPTLINFISTALNPVISLINRVLSPAVTQIIDMIVALLVPAIETISSVIEYISTFLEPINILVDFLLSALGSQLVDTLKIIADLLSPIIFALQLINGIVKDFTDALKSLFSGDFGDFGDRLVKMFKNAFSNILRFLASIIDGIVNAIIGFINAIIANDAVKTIASWFGGEGWKGIEWRLDLASLVPQFATGGIVGEIWQMNEYGNPEMLYNSNNSNTAVITQAQLSQALEQAIYNTGILDAIANGGNVYIDGKEIAQSKNFKSELNRTNPSLNLR